jgi:hypothetical protein
MRDQALSRRGFLGGSSAVAAGALLMPRGLLGAAPRAAARTASTPVVTGATVQPRVYGVTGWAKGASIFDSYVGMPLATTIQKVYMAEGQYYTDPLPSHLTSLAKAGCEFIICVYPSRTTDESAKLAAFLQLLNSKGIVYRAALVNEPNCRDKFATGQDYLAYWSQYAPVVQAAGVPLCYLVCASSNKNAYAKIQPGFPTSPLPDQYWIDYYGEAYRYQVRLDTAGGLLDQADGYGVPVGIGEFGYAVTGAAQMTMAMWDAYCSYLAGLAPRLQLGCLYWGSKGHDIVTGPGDSKVPGIQQVMQAF